MTSPLPTATNISLRESGYDEYWLQKQISTNPSCLGLGQLELAANERRQSTGGRLDLLLVDDDDKSMYEVELMLGETDETHIIRTIEYWDYERRVWPQRKHYAVIVAERVNRRFFNVIHLLSNAIPIIAIQASLLDVNGQKCLSFTRILDIYEEIEDGTTTSGPVNRDFWMKKASWTLETADVLLAIAKEVLPSSQLNMVRNYLALSGERNFAWIKQRSNEKSLFEVRIAEAQAEHAVQLMDSAELVATHTQGALKVTVSLKAVKENVEAFRKLIALAAN
jgi:hypothetical protein